MKEELYLLRKSKLFSTPSRPTWTIKGLSDSPLLIVNSSRSKGEELSAHTKDCFALDQISAEKVLP